MSNNILDEVVFNELKETTGDDFVEELVVAFLEEAPQMVSDLQSALEASDEDAFRRAAHSLKSNANVFGATDLSEIARKLELEGGTGGEISQLQTVLTKTEEVLRGRING